MSPGDVRGIVDAVNPVREMVDGHIFASMSGMLDLSRDEKAKHFLPRWS